MFGKIKTLFLFNYCQYIPHILYCTYHIRSKLTKIHKKGYVEGLRVYYQNTVFAGKTCLVCLCLPIDIKIFKMTFAETAHSTSYNITDASSYFTSSCKAHIIM